MCSEEKIVEGSDDSTDLAEAAKACGDKAKAAYVKFGGKANDWAKDLKEGAQEVIGEHLKLCGGIEAKDLATKLSSGDEAVRKAAMKEARDACVAKAKELHKAVGGKGAELGFEIDRATAAVKAAYTKLKDCKEAGTKIVECLQDAKNDAVLVADSEEDVEEIVERAKTDLVVDTVVGECGEQKLSAECIGKVGRIIELPSVASSRAFVVRSVVDEGARRRSTDSLDACTDEAKGEKEVTKKCIEAYKTEYVSNGGSKDDAEDAHRFGSAGKVADLLEGLKKTRNDGLKREDIIKAAKDLHEKLGHDREDALEDGRHELIRRTADKIRKCREKGLKTCIEDAKSKFGGDEEDFDLEEIEQRIKNVVEEKKTKFRLIAKSVMAKFNIVTEKTKEQIAAKKKQLEDKIKESCPAALAVVKGVGEHEDGSKGIRVVIKQLKGRFTPSGPDIKKRIASLIDLEYLERDDNDRSLYHYKM